MSDAVVQDLTRQYQHTFKILVEEIERFTDEDWLKGITFFQTPVVQAMHILDCLDFYAGEDTGQAYTWGHGFGGGWWELALDRMPAKKLLVVYAREIEQRIMAQLSGLSDADLMVVRPQPTEGQTTVIGHHLYALKHTLHHHGQLAALSVWHGHAGGSWD